MHKKAIKQKTTQVGSLTLLSRILGLVREILMGRYLGASLFADAFLTAYKIPNSLRKIFAEGALSAAFIPTIVNVIKKNNKQEVNRLMTLSFLLFEGILIALCLLIFWQAGLVIHLFALGWFKGAVPLVQATYATNYLRILIAFIVFLSSSALLAGVLQSVNHFFVPAFSPVLLNIVFISALLICLYFGLSVEALCYFILFGGMLQFLLHITMYLKLGFSFDWFDAESLQQFRGILARFFACALGMSVMEINLVIGTTLASYLPEGSISLLYYANRFMGIPVGVFAVAFSTVLLPVFSRISIYAPKRLSFYLLEAAKLIFWVTIPISLLMSFFSEKIFLTLFLSKKFSLIHVYETASILIAFLSGLFFFSLNKILLNVYYSLKKIAIPVFISLVATMSYTLISMIFLWQLHFGATGLALAYVISGIIQTILFLFFLYKQFHFKLYIGPFVVFAFNALKQLIPFIFCFLLLYYGMKNIIMNIPMLQTFLLYKIGFWLWAGPLSALMFWGLLKTRRWFNLRLYFLD